MNFLSGEVYLSLSFTFHVRAARLTAKRRQRVVWLGLSSEVKVKPGEHWLQALLKYVWAPY